MYRYIKKGSRGFTLIELLVVIAIIGILASVVLAGLGSQRDRAREASALSSARSLVPVMQVCRDAGSIIVQATVARPVGNNGSIVCADPGAVSSERYPALPAGWSWQTAGGIQNTGTDGFQFTANQNTSGDAPTAGSGVRRITCTQNNCAVTSM